MNDALLHRSFAPSDEDIAFVKTLPHKALTSISAVVPSFNQGKFLARTLDSIINQNYPAMEIFIADGGSKDDSPDILASYAAKYPKIVHFVSEQDKGHYDGINKGIANTTGEIIAWINSDDLYMPDAFWKVAAFFHFNRCAGVVYGRGRYVDAHLNVICEYLSPWSSSQRELRRKMRHHCVVSQPSLFFKRWVVQQYGSLKKGRALDYELWLRWMQDVPFYYYDELLSLSVVHQNAISARADKNLLTEICHVVHNHAGAVPFNWTMGMAHNHVHGAAWTRGESPPFTSAIRRRAVFLFAALNLRWLPRGIAHYARHCYAWLKDIIWGKV